MNRRRFFRAFAGATVATAVGAKALMPRPMSPLVRTAHGIEAAQAAASEKYGQALHFSPAKDTLLAADGNELRVARPTRFMPGDIIHFPGAMAAAYVVDSDLTMTVRWVNTTPGRQPAEGDTILRIGNGQMPIEVTQ